MIEIRCRAWRFTFRPGFALLALAATVAMVMLGNWQTRRAEQKLELQQRVDALAQGPALSLPSTPVAVPGYEHSRITVRGEFVPQYTVFVDNRVLRGVPGYHVVTPFKIRGGDMHVLVNRGWVGVGPTRERFPHIPTPGGEFVLEGLAVVPPERVYELARETGTGPLVQHIELARIRQRTGLRLQPLVLEQTSETPDGLARVWDRPDLGVNTHRAYALQWYAMGVVIVILYFSLNLKRGHGGDGAR
jgi:surfeit locus 1 family protein